MIEPVNHRYDTYPYRGYLWLAGYHDSADLMVTSNDCRNAELKAYTRVRDSTVGYFGARWPSGIRMYRQFCDGTVALNTDIRLRYRANKHFIRADGTSYGGYNVSALAPSSWCAVWGRSHPCGSHPSVVHLNKSRFTSSYTAHYKRRLIMHETGHSLGLAHHCNSTSIMNDGTGGCNGGAWTNIDGYQQTDRDGVHGIYPHWRYTS